MVKCGLHGGNHRFHWETIDRIKYEQIEKNLWSNAVLETDRKDSNKQ